MPLMSMMIAVFAVSVLIHVGCQVLRQGEQENRVAWGAAVYYLAAVFIIILHLRVVEIARQAEGELKKVETFHGRFE